MKLKAGSKVVCVKLFNDTKDLKIGGIYTLVSEVDTEESIWWVIHESSYLHHKDHFECFDKYFKKVKKADIPTVINVLTI